MKKVIVYPAVALLCLAATGIYFLCDQPVKKKIILNTATKGLDAKKPPRGSMALYNAEYQFKKQHDPSLGRLPANIKSKELKFAKTLPKNDSQRGQEWEWRGPADMGGRMLCLAFDVDDENTILAGSASGGMWKTAERTQYWEKVTEPNVEQSATCIAQDTRPGKHHIWYYGTGELLSTTDRNISTNVRTIGIGNGIFKSIDNGDTWQALESTTGGSQGTLDEIFQGVWNIVTDPVTMDKDVVYAACYGAIMRSEDAGNSWELVLGDIANKSFATDITITSDGVLYAALSSYCWSVDRPEKAGVWRSEDGIHWVNITPDDFPSETRVMKLAIAPSNENVVYLFTESQSDVLQPFNGIFNTKNTFWKYSYDQTSDNGVWEERTQNIPGAGDGNFTTFPNSFLVYGGYTMDVTVKPDDENVVFLAGMMMFRSENGFSDTLQTFLMGGWPFDMDSIHQLHSDQHRIAFLPSDPNVMFVANDGGIYRTDNCMEYPSYWHRQNYRLITAQFYSVCVDHASSDDNFILGGLQDNNWYFTATDNVAEFWLSIDICYDGFATAIANDLEYCVISAYSGNIWTSQFGEQMHTENIFFQLPDTLLKFYDPIMGSNSLFPFYQNFALDPINNETFYLPTKKSIWRKHDMKAASYDTSLRNTGWEHLSNVNVGEASQITIISASWDPPNTVFYGTDLGKVYRLDNAHTGNPVPVDITGDIFPENAYVACIDVDPDNTDNIMVVFSNYGVLSLFLSGDGGTTWSAQGGNLEEFPDGSGSGPSIRFVERLNYQGNTVFFAGTSVGLFSTTELKGDSTMWAQEGADYIGNIIVDMIDARQSDGFVAVATHGNGIYSTYYDPSYAVNELKNNPFLSLSIYPNPCNDVATIRYEISDPGKVAITIMDISGRLIKNLHSGYQASGIHNYSTELTDIAPGTYLIKIENRGQFRTKKLIINR